MTTGKPQFRIKRIYAPAADDDGFRVLVDRLWPRGISKEKARIDLWMKDISPSDALRRQFHGNPDGWEAFLAAYADELEAEPARAAAAELRERLSAGTVTLLYAARDETHNNAEALRRLLARDPVWSGWKIGDLAELTGLAPGGPCKLRRGGDRKASKPPFRPPARRTHRTSAAFSP